MGTRIFWRTVPAILLLVGCANDRGPLSPSDVGGNGVETQALFSCNANVADGYLACSALDPASAGTADLALIGNQGSHIQLESFNVSYNPSTLVFSADVSIWNMLTQTLGTSDGVNADPEGVRVFFVTAPATTGGSGSVTVRNADGTADFNATDQPFFRYEQALAPGVRSLRKTWEWTVPTSVESFEFLVGVAASLPDENDIQAGLKFVTKAIASDSTSTCVIHISGQAYCWGMGERGRLGTGSTDDQPVPAPVDQGALRFVSIGAGIAHGCALTDTGKAYCWGGGNLGRLGNGGSGNMYSPVPVLGGHTFVQLTASRVSTCALTEDGTAYCWGYNNFGQLGNGTTDTALVPTPVAGGHKFKHISTGRFHTCGVTTDNKAYCWGSPGTGRLGNGVIGGDPVTQPTPVLGSYEFSYIAAGSTHTCALTPEGKAYCWGGSTFGRLGVGVTDYQPIPVPAEVKGGHSFRTISVGGLHTCAVSHEGKAYCWGSQARGKVGNGETAADSVWEPFEVPGLSNVTDIVASADHTCATTADGKVYCWGNGSAHRLGNGETTNKSTPTEVSGLTGVAWFRDTVEACGVDDGLARCFRRQRFSEYLMLAGIVVPEPVLNTI